MIAGIGAGNILSGGGVERLVGGADIAQPLVVGVGVIVEFGAESLAGIEDIFEGKAGWFGAESGLLRHVEEIGFVAEIPIARHNVEAGVMIFAGDDVSEEGAGVFL